MRTAAAAHRGTDLDRSRPSRREPAVGDQLGQQAARRVPHHRGLLVEGADHGGRVVGDLPERLLREHVGVRPSLRDGLGVVRPVGVSPAYPFSSKNSTQLSQLDGQQPEPVDEDDRRLPARVGLLNLSLLAVADPSLRGRSTRQPSISLRSEVRSRSSWIGLPSGPPDVLTPGSRGTRSSRGRLRRGWRGLSRWPHAEADRSPGPSKRRRRPCGAADADHRVAHRCARTVAPIAPLRRRTRRLDLRGRLAVARPARRRTQAGAISRSRRPRHRYLSAFEPAPTLDQGEGRAPSARLGQLGLGLAA